MTGSPLELRKNAIGMWQIVFFVIAAAAPLTGMLGIMRALLLSSIFACLLAFHNTITRYLYALGREGWLWGFLAGVHPRHQSPYKASYVQTGCAVGGAGVGSERG